MADRKRQTSLWTFFDARTGEATAAAATTVAEVDEANVSDLVIDSQAESTRCDHSNNDIGLYVGKSLDDASKERTDFTD